MVARQHTGLDAAPPEERAAEACDEHRERDVEPKPREPAAVDSGLGRHLEPVVGPDGASTARRWAGSV